MTLKKLLNKIIKTITFIVLIIISFFILSLYFQIDYIFSWNDSNVQINRCLTYVYFILFFYILFYLVNPKIYLFSFYFILIIGGGVWILLFFFKSSELYATTLRNTITIPLFSVISIGLSLIIIQVIKSVSKTFANNSLFEKYHVHEGFLGIILIILGGMTWSIRILNIYQVGYQENNRFFFSIYSIFIFLFFFCGSFLIFRDWRDIVHLRFIDKILYLKKPLSTNTNDFKAFNKNIEPNNHFFKSPKILLYPIGLLIASFSQVALIHDYDFLPFEFFNIDREVIVFISMICIFLSGGLIGLDWHRFFFRCFPRDYTDLEQILTDYNKKKRNSSSKIDI